jgi:hypothetical protein
VFRRDPTEEYRIFGNELEILLGGECSEEAVVDGQISAG